MYIKHRYSSIIDRWKCREIINFRDFSAASESAGKFKNKYMRYRKYTMSKMQRPSRKCIVLPFSGFCFYTTEISVFKPL